MWNSPVLSHCQTRERNWREGVVNDNLKFAND